MTLRPNETDAQEFVYTMAGSRDASRWNTIAAYTANGHDLATLVEGSDAPVDQALAVTERNRWLAFIRNSGSATPSQNTFHYIGGDVTDAVKKTSDNKVIWTMSDYFANVPSQTAVNAGDTYNINPLSGLQRNGAVAEDVVGTFSAQLYGVEPTSGIWLDAVTHGGETNKIFWPLTIAENLASTMFVGAWLCDPTTPTAHGTLVDSSIITLNAFGGYGSHVNLGFGAVTDKFFVQCIRRDATHFYILGGEFFPSYNNLLTSGRPTFAVGDQSELKTHYMLTRLARVPIASLTTPSAWTFWNGSAWVSGVTNAVPLTDTYGNEIRGAAGISKTAAGHWLLVANKVADTHVSVYSADSPQGPWLPIARVPIPYAGKSIGGGTTAAWHTKIIDHLAAPAEHSICSVTMTLLNPTADLSTMNIRRWAPQFVVVPWY